MDGIEILNQTEIMKDIGSCWWIGLIVLGLCVLLGFIIGFFEDAIIPDTIMGLIFGIGIGLISAGFGSDIPLKQVPTGTYEYQVIISEDVNFVEFNEKYEIIKQEGKIYTVVLKEDKED